MNHTLYRADCLSWMKTQPDDSVDLVFGSPPYEDARTYGIKMRIKGQAWVDWMIPQVLEAVRICNGLVAIVVEGRTRNFRWSATPVLLMADLHRAGVCLRKPPAFYRVGIPGSGGPDWWRNDYEFVVCCTSGGKLPWSENTATGKPTKYDEGGASTNRKADGSRVGYVSQSERALVGAHRAQRQAGRKYAKPQNGIANPGNVIFENEEATDFIRCKVGGGAMGSDLAHENEAPFPESLVEPFVRCFCPPLGITYDPWCGSGSVAAVCEQWGRHSIGTDVRESQVELATLRIEEARRKTDQGMLF